MKVMLTLMLNNLKQRFKRHDQEIGIAGCLLAPFAGIGLILFTIYSNMPIIPIKTKALLNGIIGIFMIALFVYSFVRIVIEWKKSPWILRTLLFFSSVYLGLAFIQIISSDNRFYIYSFEEKQSKSIIFRYRWEIPDGRCNNKTLIIRNGVPQIHSLSKTIKGCTLRFHDNHIFYYQESCCESPATIDVMNLRGEIVSDCAFPPWEFSDAQTNEQGELVSKSAWERIYSACAP